MTTDNLVQELCQLMATLRDPDAGCPWDLAQNFASIAPMTLEEAYEVVDAIERNHLGDLKDELADLLLHVIYYAQMAKETEAFTFHDVATHLRDKMIRRHPHVFDKDFQSQGKTAKGVWEAAKESERANKPTSDNSHMSGIAQALPALMRAEKIQNRAKQVGFDWPDMQGALGKIQEEYAEVQQAIAGKQQAEIEEELGDLLFSVVNLARFCDVNPEYALKRATAKFESRFRQMETMLADPKAMKTMSLPELDALWDQAKGLLKQTVNQ